MLTPLKCMLHWQHTSSTLQPMCSSHPQHGVAHNSGPFNDVLPLTSIKSHLAHLFPLSKVAFKSLEWALYLDRINPLTARIGFTLLIVATATPNLLAAISRNCSQPIKSANEPAEVGLGTMEVQTVQGIHTKSDEVQQ